jgi:hypothetical protein
MTTTPPTITTNDKSNYHRIMTTTPPTITTNDKSNYHRIMTTTPPTITTVVIVGGVVVMILW